MAGTAKEAPVINRGCQMCAATGTTVAVRGRSLCRDCLLKYVETKAVKRMESYNYRVRDSTKERNRILLLPISLGRSSLVLLHVVHNLLRSQYERSNRAGFALHILHVETIPKDNSSSITKPLESLKTMYPGHTYSTLPLSHVFDQSNVLPLIREELELTPRSMDGLEQVSMDKKLGLLLSSLPSATSQADVIEILMRILIARFAIEHGCESILWGHTTTRLAERTLAETAKGRGFSLPWQISDGLSPYGIEFKFPMRDLLRREVMEYTNLTYSSLVELVAPGEVPEKTSGKRMAIDHLMMQYFETVEDNYPSIVSNVVRTSNKLRAPDINQRARKCGLCHLPTEDGYPSESESGKIYGSGHQSPEILCYGCAVSLRSGGS